MQCFLVINLFCCDAIFEYMLLYNFICQDFEQYHQLLGLSLIGFSRAHLIHLYYDTKIQTGSQQIKACVEHEIVILCIGQRSKCFLLPLQKITKLPQI